MQLTELRKELQFNGDLLNLIDTLKNVAAAQYHLMEKQKERFDEFMDALPVSSASSTWWTSRIRWCASFLMCWELLW